MGITNIYEFNNKIDDLDRVCPLSTIFSVPILYYGDRIKPGSLKISGRIARNPDIMCHLMDNGDGTLIRSDVTSSIAYNTKVGQVYYESGIIAISHPHLYQFGNEFFRFEFQGEKKMHVYEVNIPCEPGMVNLSHNKTYVDLKPSYDNDDTDKFVYIGGVNIHDENLNIVAKARLSRPIVKRDQDRFMFRLKLDY